MSQLLDLINSNPSHNPNDLLPLFRKHLTSIEQTDVQVLLQTYLPKQNLATRQQCLQAYENINRMCQRLQENNVINTSFYINSLIKIDGTYILQQKIQQVQQIDVNSQFKDILGQDFYRKLITYGSNGLLQQKLEETNNNKYSFFHWIQNNIQIPLFQDTDCLPLQLLKHVWAFNVNQTLTTMAKIKIAFPQDQQINSLEIGLSIIGQIYSVIKENEELKQVFIDRKQFDIHFESGHANKTEEKEFNAKIYEIKQKLFFVANYFQFIKKSFKNQYYYAIAEFLSNKEDNFVKDLQEPIMNIQQISMTDKFFYAKKFYRNQDFQQLKAYLNEKSQSFNTLQHILLFGTKKQSEQILQNYIDETNQIQKTAIVSVYLLIFLQQGNIGRKENKIAFYSKFKKYYEFLLTTLDSGIAKHKYDQKRIAIEVERKRKTMNKTFNFNCLNCKSSQCLQSIGKRIIIDSKHRQVKMKGNNLFSKDMRNQVMFCLDCMFLLPKCSICLFPITMYNGYSEEIKKNYSNLRVTNGGESIDNALVWCPKCFHGGHLAHVMKWMQRTDKRCPVYTCKCKCVL